MINNAKQKLRNGEPAYGFALGLGSPLAAELLSRSGVDFLLADAQHGAWGHDSIFAALMAMAGGSAVPMARVAKNDYTLIGKLLDQGAIGVVVPMVDTAEQAKAAAAACRFPPRGTRSWGIGRARTLGSDYTEWIDTELFLALQIESAMAVEHAEEILSVEGVDGCWVGPTDLALSLGIHPRHMAEDDRHARALERVLRACRSTGKVPGLACASAEEAKYRAGQGFRFLTCGSDVGFLGAGADAALRTVRLESAV